MRTVKIITTADLFLVDRAEVRCKTGHSRARLLIYLASVLAIVTVNGVKKKRVALKS
jgi:hypothetical protein